MAYQGKTDWKLNDTVMPEDMNRIESQVLENSKIGQTGAQESTLKEVKSSVENVNTNVTDVKNKIGNTTDTDATDKTGTVMGKLNALIGTGTVKSIQRGVANFNTTNTTVTISSINLSKSLLLFGGIGVLNGTTNNSATHTGYAYLQSSTQIYFSRSSSRDTTVEMPWQVIEFY